MVKSNKYRVGLRPWLGPPGHIKDQLQNGKPNLIQFKHVALDEVEQMLGVAYKKDSKDIPSIGFLCYVPSLVDYRC